MSDHSSDLFSEENEDLAPRQRTEGRHASSRHSAPADRPRSRGEGEPTRRRPPEDARRRSASGQPPRRRRKKKKKHTGRTVLIVVLVLLVLLAAAVYFVYMHFYGLLGKEDPFARSTATPTPAAQTVQTVTDDATPAPTAEPTPTPTPRPLTEEELREQEEQELLRSLQEDADEILSDGDVYNVLLIGVDGLESAMERSDSMNLVSVNFRTKQIWITSMMRDTEVTIPNWGLGHLNWATSYDGIQLLIDTIESEKNFAIKIDNWAVVNFLSFVDAANLLGPITVEVQAKEVRSMNRQIRQVCQMIDEAAGRGPDDPNNMVRYYFPTKQTGTYTISDGAQILGYARERAVGGDTGRSAKQREVLMQMWGNVAKMSIAEQYQVAKALLPIVTTDISAGKLASLLLKLPAMKDFEIHTQQCPVPGSFWKGRDRNNLSIYNADFRVNRNFLRATIYGERLTKDELTSGWTGVRELVYWPEEWNEPAG